MAMVFGGQAALADVVKNVWQARKEKFYNATNRWPVQMDCRFPKMLRNPSLCRS